MAELAAVARESGLEQLHLDVPRRHRQRPVLQEVRLQRVRPLPKALKLPGRTADGAGATPYRDRILMALEL
jgi:hypothetical protein